MDSELCTSRSSPTTSSGSPSLTDHIYHHHPHLFWATQTANTAAAAAAVTVHPHHHEYNEFVATNHPEASVLPGHINHHDHLHSVHHGQAGAVEVASCHHSETTTGQNRPVGDHNRTYYQQYYQHYRPYYHPSPSNRHHHQQMDSSSSLQTANFVHDHDRQHDPNRHAMTSGPRFVYQDADSTVLELGQESEDASSAEIPSEVMRQEVIHRHECASVISTSNQDRGFQTIARDEDRKPMFDQVRILRPHSTPATLHWLEQNYELSDGVCIPRSTLYTHYVDFCARNGTQPVNAASFGKIIRQQFPQLTTRRLGTRGQSRYHYYGIGIRETSIYFQLAYARKSVPSHMSTKISSIGDWRPIFCDVN